MGNKHLVFIGIIIAITLLFVSTLFYPGGSQQDKNSIGYDWKNNYISNLFGETAVNGARSASPPWAAGGMFFLSISFGLFFIEFSKKIPDRSASKVIKYFGVAAMICAFLAVTPYHDTMITIADTLALVSMFYITVFIFKSTLHSSKILSVLCLLSVYICTYLYYTRSYLEMLPLMQKASFAMSIIWILWLEYFTKGEDFQHIKTATTDRSTKQE